MVQTAPQDLLNDFLKYTLPGILAKRLGDPSEFAHAVKFLVENAYMNGTILKVDSGLRLSDAQLILIYLGHVKFYKANFINIFNKF